MNEFVTSQKRYLISDKDMVVKILNTAILTYQ